MFSSECCGTLLMIDYHWFRWWLGAVRQQAITWANDGYMACLGHHELEPSLRGMSPGHGRDWYPDIILSLQTTATHLVRSSTSEGILLETDSQMSYLLLTQWDLVTHIQVNKLTIIGSDNGLLPDRCQAIIWANAGITLIRTQGTNFSEIVIEIHTFSFKQENVFENVVCKIVAILSRTQWLKW